MSDFIARVNSLKFNVLINDDTKLTLDDEKFDYELIQVSHNSYSLKLNNKVFELVVEQIGNDLVNVLVNGNNYEVTVRTALQEKAHELLENSSSKQSRRSEVKAPMPGLILKIKKNVGEKVEQGESIIILEAMKMENDLKAPFSGSIEKIFITEGSAVEKGTVLFSLA